MILAAASAATDANLVLHARYGLETIPGSSVLDAADLAIIDSGLACDTFNIVYRARLASARAPNRITTTIAHFTSSRRPFSWWVGPADQPASLGSMLLDAGLGLAETSLAMSADLTALAHADLSPNGLEVRRVRTDRMLGDLARILAGWEQPDPVVLRFYQLAAPALMAPTSPRWFFVGYLDGEPISTAEVTVADGVAGLYGVVTREAFRRRGFGTALTAGPLLEARAAGCRTGVLQASEAGAGVYRRLGFREFGEIREFK